MILNISPINTSSNRISQTKKNYYRTSTVTFMSKIEETAKYENLNYKKLNSAHYKGLGNDLDKLNQFAKENNKEIILISKDNFILMHMRPLKKDSNFFKRLLRLDVSSGSYHISSYYPPLFLAKTLLDEISNGKDTEE